MLVGARAGDVRALAEILSAGPPLRRAQRNRMGAVDTAAQQRSRKVSAELGPREGGGEGGGEVTPFATLAAQALVEATREGHVDAVRLLLDRGADPNWQGGTGGIAEASAPPPTTTTTKHHPDPTIQAKAGRQRLKVARERL